MLICSLSNCISPVFLPWILFCIELLRNGHDMLHMVPSTASNAATDPAMIMYIVPLEIVTHTDGSLIF